MSLTMRQIRVEELKKDLRALNKNKSCIYYRNDPERLRENDENIEKVKQELRTIKA